MVELLRKLRWCSWRDRWLLARTTLALALAQVAVRRLPFRVAARALRLREGTVAPGIDTSQAKRAARIGATVAVVASYLPWRTTCLVEALAAAALLRLEGIDTTLSLGVARDDFPSRDLTAHAWLSYGPLVITGASEQARYATLASFATR